MANMLWQTWADMAGHEAGHDTCIPFSQKLCFNSVFGFFLFWGFILGFLGFKGTRLRRVFWGFCLGWGSPGNGLELFFAFVSSFTHTRVSELWDFLVQKWPPVEGMKKPVYDLTFFVGHLGLFKAKPQKPPLTMLSSGALLEKCHRLRKLRKRDIVRVFSGFLHVKM